VFFLFREPATKPCVNVAVAEGFVLKATDGTEQIPATNHVGDALSNSPSELHPKNVCPLLDLVFHHSMLINGNPLK
jgi:hypothetical protein